MVASATHPLSEIAYPHGVTLRLEMVNPEGEHRIVCFRQGEDPIVLDDHLLLGLQGMLKDTKQRVAMAAADMQLLAHHPSKRHPTIPPRATFLSPPNIDEVVVGTPYLAWTTLVDSDPHSVWGWQLRVEGMDLVLGSARWDDPSGQDALLQTMEDPEQALALAGVMEPTQAAVVSARRQALRLRQARSLPALELAQVRRQLAAAGLTTTGSKIHRMRNVTIEVEDKRLHVAAAILPSLARAYPPDPQDYQRRIAAWCERAAAVVSAVPGWRVVDLPEPEKSYYRSPVVYVTKIAPHAWNLISPAAAEVTRHQLDLGTGGVRF